MLKKFIYIVFMVAMVMGMSAASQAGIITVESASGDPGAAVSIPIKIDDTAGQPDLSFSVSFDNEKVEYTGKTSGDMGADVLVPKTPEEIAQINTDGKVQPIVQFDVATSGIIVKFNFKIKSGVAGGTTPLTIGDIASKASPQFTGVSGQIDINAPECTSPTITVGDVNDACDKDKQIVVPIKIDDTAGQPDVRFSVSFDNTKLKYTGKTSGDMGADVLVPTTPEEIALINADGKVQPIVQFDVATSGTIVNFNFTLPAAIPPGSETPLTIGDIARPEFCGESGTVSCVSPCPVTIDPETPTVQEGDTQTFSATVAGTGCATPAFIWSLAPVNTTGSNIIKTGSNTARYRAGSITDKTKPATDTITVEDTANNSKANAVVTVNPAECTVAISPKTASVESGDTIEFKAVSSGTCATAEYSWSIDTNIDSQLTPNGDTAVYTAGPNDTPLPVTDKITVTDNANGGKSDTATVVVGVKPPCEADLTIDPTEGPQGQTRKVKLTADEDIFKGVDKKDIIVDFDEGITSTIKDKSANTLKVEIMIDAIAARVGKRTVIVAYAPDKCAQGTFTVAEGLTITIDPSTGRAGGDKMDVTITGVGTHFKKDNTKVKFGKGIDKDNKTVVNETTITLKIKIGKDAPTGPGTVTVTTGLGNNVKEVVTGTFRVLSGSAE